MNFIVYKTTNTLNGKFYVGQHQTENLNDNYLGSGTLLKQSIKKYGIENFKAEVLEACESKEHLNIREIYWIDKLNATNKTIAYNISKGGDGGDSELMRKFWSNMSAEELLNHKCKMRKPKQINDKIKWINDRKSSTKQAWNNGKFTKRSFVGVLNPRHNDITSDVINSIKYDYESMILTKGEIFKKYNIGHTVFHRISKEFKHPPHCWWNSKRGIR